MNLCVVRYVSNARTVNMTRLTAFAAACEQYLRSTKKKKRRAIRTQLRSRKTLGEYAATVRQMYQDPTAGTSSSPSVCQEPSKLC